jgi:hypothetical protein
MGGTHTHPQNLSPTEIIKYNPCGPGSLTSYLDYPTGHPGTKSLKT